MYLRRPSCSLTTHPFQCSIPVQSIQEGAGPRPGGSPVYVRDDRPWAGPDPPAAVYFYSPDRKAERPAAHLERFRGVLQVDGYAGFETLAAKGDRRATPGRLPRTADLHALSD